MKTIKFRIAIFVSLLAILMIVGTAGFMVFERLSLVDAIYFTIVTISTVGYGDIHASTLAGKVLAVVLIVIGVGVFLGLVADATQMLLHRRQERNRKQRINVLIGVFFSELGSDLLKLFSTFDPGVADIQEDSLIDEGWSDEDFVKLRRRLEGHDYDVDPRRIEMNEFRAFLNERGDLLVRLLENPNLQEHETFTNLLLALFHLKDEIIARRDFSELPEADLAHLANDAKRAYQLLARQWVAYMHYLKLSYPYLFSLALRTNPFSPKSSPIVG